MHMIRLLKKIPLHKRQYAYKPGMGMETAISKVLDTIEKGMMKRQYAVGCFLDNASAFNRLDSEKQRKRPKGEA